MDENKKRALDAALKQIEKQFGQGSVIRMGDENTNRNIESVSSGSLGLDIALGIGGYPLGRVIEIYGPESSGKTTLTLHAIAEMQKKGGTAAFIDAEHALDPTYAEKVGVNLADLYVSQPDTGEQALEITDTLVRSGGVDMIIIDSVAALTPKAEIEGDMGDSHVGLQARLMSQALRKLTGNIKRTNTIVIFINQIRMKIGVMFGNIGSRVTDMNQMNNCIAVSAEEQNVMSGEIGRSIDIIKSLNNESVKDASSLLSASNDVDGTSRKIESLLKKFKVA